MVQKYRGVSFPCALPQSILKFIFHIRLQLSVLHSHKRLGRLADLHLRRARRYEVSAPVSYWWAASKGPIHSSAGETLNISDSGVLVAASECPPMGASIQMTVLLPRLRDKGFGMKLHGEGMVVRVENGDTPLSAPAKAFAASVQFYPETSDQPEKLKRDGVEKLKTTVQ